MAKVKEDGSVVLEHPDLETDEEVVMGTVVKDDKLDWYTATCALDGKNFIYRKRGDAVASLEDYFIRYHTTLAS